MIDFNNINICCALAKYGQLPILNKLVTHPEAIVRKEVAKRGYKHHLKLLKDDINADVRYAIARQGVYLDQFVKDKSYHVRLKVAQQGYKLNILVNDENNQVRMQSFIKLDKSHILKYIKTYHPCGINIPWLKRVLVHHDIKLKTLRYDPDYKIRKEIAKKGLYPDKFINDPAWQVRKVIVKQDYKLEIFKDDPSSKVRAELAKKGLYLDQYLYDPAKLTRRMVAQQGYGLHILKDDINKQVREVVVKQGYNLDYFINDKDILVREALAKHHLDKYYKNEFDYIHLKWY